MTDNAGNFDLFDPTLLPERPVTGAEMQAAFGISGDALRAAVLSGKLPPAAEVNWMRNCSIWYVGQIREFFRGKCQEAIRKDRVAAKSAPPTSCSMPSH